MNAYPNAQHLKSFLATASITVSNDTELQYAIEAGIEEVESRLGRHMLAGKDIGNAIVAEEARTFDLRLTANRLLLFGPKNDLQHLTSVIYMPTSTGPVTWAEGVNFDLIPENASQRGLPWEGLRVYPWWDGFSWHGVPQGYYTKPLQVTGLWGYGNSIPGDVWQAMRAAGALRVPLSEFVVLGSTAGALKSWTAPGGVSATFQTGWLHMLHQQWQDAVDNAVTAHRKMEF